MPSPTEITVAQLAHLVGTPACPVLIDICIDEDFAADPRFIPGAVRHPFNQIEDLVPSLADKKVVIVCQKGKKLSQGAAAILRTHGIDAKHLEGGNFSWRDLGLPLVPAAAIPDRRVDGHTQWVTGHRPKIDRNACAWLIRRFVDPGARILFVAPSDVTLVAEKFKATPFEVEDVVFSHRGDQCTFDAMLEAFELDFDALGRLAMIVRGADRNRHDLAPESAGLFAATLGLSRMYKDDLALLEAGLVLYDALYSWARDAADEGYDELAAES